MDEAARGVVRLVSNSMSKAISMVSIERGRDPREFTMVCFGGAGPVHSCDIAEELGVREIIVPVHAGLFSAYGLLVADLTRTFVLPIVETTPSLVRRFAELKRMAVKEMREEGFRDFTLQRFIEARYEGQSHELLLQYQGDAGLRKAFDRRHRQVYGYSSTDRLQIVNARIRASVGRTSVPRLSSTRLGSGPTEAKRTVWVGGRTSEVPVHERETLQTGDGGVGPCVVEEYDSTLVVNPGWTWRVEDLGMRLTR